MRIFDVVPHNKRINLEIASKVSHLCLSFTEVIVLWNKKMKPRTIMLEEHLMKVIMFHVTYVKCRQDI